MIEAPPTIEERNAHLAPALHPISHPEQTNPGDVTADHHNTETSLQRYTTCSDQLEARSTPTAKCRAKPSHSERRKWQIHHMKLQATVQSVDKSVPSIRGVVVPPYAAPTAARALSTCTEHTCCSLAAAMVASPQTQTIRLLSKLPKTPSFATPSSCQL